VVGYCGWFVSAVAYRCDLMCKLIKLHTRGCVGCQMLAGCVSIGEYVAQLILLVWGWVGWMARSLEWAKILLSRQLLRMSTR